ncbi:hypothetical protein ACIGN6_21135 [Streptomyces sp. NPDC053792]|uniref:hypothetical protein n=1 Tax=Streptomyces sp. NPDC053792 TaxID=3365716 RepID=UPI0037D878DC
MERAQLLANHSRQGTLTLSPISLIASLSEPDVDLLRAAVVENMRALHRRVGINISASSPQEAAVLLATFERKARREGRTWGLHDFTVGPVREGSMEPLAEVAALFSRDSDEEIDPYDLEGAVDAIMNGLTATGTGLGDGVPISLLVPDKVEEIRAEVRRRLLGTPTFQDECELIRSVAADQLVKACLVVPLARRVQVIAVKSARIAHLRHTGEPTEGAFRGVARPRHVLRRHAADDRASDVDELGDHARRGRGARQR